MNVFFLVLIVSLVGGELTRWQFGSGIAVSALDIVSLFSLCFMLIQTIRHKLHFYPVAKAFHLFLLVCLLSLIANFHALSLIQIGVASLYIVRFASVCSIAVLLYNLSKEKKQFVEKLMLIGGCSIVFIGFVQLLYYPSLKNLYYLGWDEHLNRLFSTFLDPNFASVFFALFSVFLLQKSLSFIEQKQKGKIIGSVILFLFSVSALFLTYSRTGYTVFLVSFLVTLCYQKNRLVLFTACTLLLICGYVLLPHRLEGNNLLRTASTYARISTDQHAITIFEKNPIFGIGFNAYRYAQFRYGFLQGSDWITTHSGSGPENSFLLVLATTGIIGSIAYVYLLIQLGHYFKKEHRALWMGFLVSGLFLNSLFYPFLLAWIILLTGSM